MESSVSPEMYNTSYFKKDIRTTVNMLETGGSQIHQKIVNILNIKPNQVIIDFGCGSGLLSFLLNNKYGCKVIGIDYSKDGINLCNEYKKDLKINNIEFINSDINTLPKLSDASVVYMADVIEHLYDNEINVFFNKINQWESKNLKVVIHTDNLNYLNWIRPFIDFINLIFFKTSLKIIKDRNQFERERHVNLTTLSRLTSKMKGFGYKLEKLEYPEITKETLAAQLGFLGSIPFVYSLVSSLYNRIKFLSPSFYCVYTKV